MFLYNKNISNSASKHYKLDEILPSKYLFGDEMEEMSSSLCDISLDGEKSRIHCDNNCLYRSIDPRIYYEDICDKCQEFLNFFSSCSSTFEGRLLTHIALKIYQLADDIPLKDILDVSIKVCKNPSEKSFDLPNHFITRCDTEEFEGYQFKVINTQRNLSKNFQ